MSKRRVRRPTPKQPTKKQPADHQGQPREPMVDPLQRLRERASQEAAVLTALPNPAGFAGDDPGDVEEPWERELLAMMKGWRHGRATRRLTQALSDGYVAVFSLLVVGAMLVNAIITAQRAVSVCDTPQCTSARALIPIATLLVCLALALATARLFGPVVASAAEGYWLMSAPIRRGKLLGKRFFGVLVAAVVIGAIFAALATMASGSDWLTIGIWAAATGLGSAMMVAIAAAEQGLDRRGPTKVATTIVAAAAVVTLLLLIAQSVGWLHLGLTRWVTHVAGFALIGASLLGLIIATALAVVRLDRIRRTRLTSGGALVAGLSGAMAALDLGLARDILVERAAQERGHVTPVLGGPTGRAALADRAAKQLLRHPGRLVAVLVSLVVPHAVSALGVPVLAPLIGALALFVALVPTLGELRVLTRTRGLARILPFSTSQQRSTLLVVPASLAGIWAVLAVPAFADWGGIPRGHDWLSAFLVAILTAAAGLLGALRWVVAKPINWNAPMVATASGALPSGMISYVVRGIDMVVLITAPMVFGMPVAVSAVIALIVFVVLLGFFSSERIQKEQAKQAAVKAKANQPGPATQRRKKAAR